MGRIPIRYRIGWFFEEIWLSMPWITNEGEATARVIDSRFDCYPDGRNLTKAAAIDLLQTIWMDIDNWDGSRVNVRAAKEVNK